MNFTTLKEYEQQARHKIEPTAFDYFAGGALDERAIDNNEAAYRRLSLRHRILRAAVEPDITTSLLNQNLTMPFVVAPVAFQAMAHPEGEVATAQATSRAGIPFILSTTSHRSFKDVSAAAGGQWWFQLYMMKDREVSKDLVKRAEAEGCRAVVLTVDVPAWGRRERDMKNKFAPPSQQAIETLRLPGREDFYNGTISTDLGTFLNQRLKFDLSWDDVEWLRSISSVPVVLKGIGDAGDAKVCAEAGVDAIFVSNHGGRQLDVAPATIEVLPSIVDAVAGRIPIIVDGGLRRGTDIALAIAMGANAVGIGRPIIWGLAANGAEGVFDVLQKLKDELKNTMTLCGCSRLSELRPEMIHRR